MALEWPILSQADTRMSLHRNCTKAFINTAARWYVIQTQPRFESRAIANLEQQGYLVFCPRIAKAVRHARKTTQILAPLFPKYVFVQLDILREPWRNVNNTSGVPRQITCGDFPQAVPSEVVEAMRARLRSKGAMDWTHSFRAGRTVRIAEGTFENFVGTFEQLDASGRVHVLLDLLGHSVSIALRCEALAVSA